MKEENPLELFPREAPEVASAFNGLIQSLIDLDGLDPKTKQLVYIGIKAASGDAVAVGFHVPMARKAGATRKEVRDTILLTLATSGLKGVASCLDVALEAYDRAE